MLKTLICCKMTPWGKGGYGLWPHRPDWTPKCIFELSRAIEIDPKKNGYENQFLSWQNAPLRSLGEGGYGLQPPVDRPLANLAMGNMCFFILRGLSCSKSPPNGFPARSSPKNAFCNRAVLLKLIKKNGYENQWVGMACSHQWIGHWLT